MQELNLTPLNISQFDVPQYNIPQLDISQSLSYTNHLAQKIEEDNQRMIKNAEEIRAAVVEKERRQQEALDRIADNSEEANSKMQRIIEQQSSHIGLLTKTNEHLEEQISAQKRQLELTEQQLQILQNIFASTEDGVLIEKEIMKLIEEQIDSNHPLWDYIKDKGGDAIVTYGIPVMYTAFKAFLVARGLELP